MAKRFVKVPLSKSIRPHRDAIHYVWLDAASITRIEYRNSDCEPPTQVTRIFYAKENGEETWYQSYSITPEDVVAALDTDRDAANVIGMLDNELSNTLLQTQLLLSEVMSSQRAAQAQCELFRCQLVDAHIELAKATPITRPWYWLFK